MYFPVHGPYVCNSRAYPTSCRYCSRDVFYFFCDHGSKVFFDDLGGRWPEHNWGSDTASQSDFAPPRPDGRVAWSQLEGVEFSIRDANAGLLPGMAHRAVDMPPAAIRRVSDSGHRPRETMRIDPLGTNSEVLAGQVAEVSVVALDERSGLESESIGLRLLGQRFPSLDAVQITIMVDEIDIDPDAEDLLSYTFWCPPSTVTDLIARNDIVQVQLEPVDALGIGRRWIAASLEIL